MMARTPRLVLALALVACRPSDSTSPEPAPTESVAAAPDACGPAQETFADLDWIPADTRFVAWVGFAEAGFDAAGEHLREAAGAAHHGLPIYAAAELGQLAFETSSLRMTLEFGGFRPNELIKLHAPQTTPVYLWPSTCDLDLARTKVTEAYGLNVRKVADGLVGSAAGSEFPFDMLFLRGDRMAFVPKGKAMFVMQWLEALPEPTLTPDPPPRPGPRLAQLAPAPFRVLLQGQSLIAGEGEAASGVRTLRAVESGVEIDGSLPSASPPKEPPHE